ncbi:hypothetical protein BDN72DRAFT_834893 [Pluteus cervinus]|uniref:Uncharacterized protein n=1 Tax=Pluteus cervinus TaxID=181527 RepID=A0ACD3B6C5_9AGAR|nr:hypothetical protein BDN72DRAFT_834893 [Pluteus cervinus]
MQGGWVGYWYPNRRLVKVITVSRPWIWPVILAGLLLTRKVPQNWGEQMVPPTCVVPLLVMSGVVFIDLFSLSAILYLWAVHRPSDLVSERNTDILQLPTYFSYHSTPFVDQ